MTTETVEEVADDSLTPEEIAVRERDAKKQQLMQEAATFRQPEITTEETVAWYDDYASAIDPDSKHSRKPHAAIVIAVHEKTVDLFIPKRRQEVRSVYHVHDPHLKIGTGYRSVGMWNYSRQEMRIRELEKQVEQLTEEFAKLSKPSATKSTKSTTKKKVE